jgi:tRNA(Ile)-lysidine synthase
VPCAASTLGRGPRTSLEAEARSARYAALAEAGVAAGACAVLLAHHRDDQAETLLLQLLRGAGPHGLARDARAASGARHRVAPSAARHLARRGSTRTSARTAFASSTTQQRRHRRARNAVRTSSHPRSLPSRPATRPPSPALRRCRPTRRGSPTISPRTTRVAPSTAPRCRKPAVAALPEHRARNLLRWFLREWRAAAAVARAASRDARRAHHAARRRARRRGARRPRDRESIAGGSSCMRPRRPPSTRRGAASRCCCCRTGALRCRRRGRRPRSRRLDGAPVTVRARRGGERLTLGPGRPRRALKSLLQDAGLATWERAALPLVFCGDALAAVPGIGVDVAFQAAREAMAWRSAGRRPPASVRLSANAARTGMRPIPSQFWRTS